MSNWTPSPITGPLPVIPPRGRRRFAGTPRPSRPVRTVTIPTWSLPTYSTLTAVTLLGTVLGVISR